MEKKLELFELRRHTEDDMEFYVIEDLLYALENAEYPVERHFYEDGNFSDQEIQSLIEKEGLGILPVARMDGKISIQGRYPQIEEIANYFDITITYEDEGECCSGEDEECCCHGHHHEEEHHCCHGEHHHDGECCHNHEHEEHHCCHHHEEDHCSCQENHEEEK